MAIHSATWTTPNISTTTNIGAAFQLRHVTVKISASVSNPVIVSLDAAAGVNYDTELIEFEPGTGIIEVFVSFDDGARFESGDEIKVACDVGANNAYCRIAYELL